MCVPKSSNNSRNLFLSLQSSSGGKSAHKREENKKNFGKKNNQKRITCWWSRGYGLRLRSRPSATDELMGVLLSYSGSRTLFLAVYIPSSSLYNYIYRMVYTQGIHLWTTTKTTRSLFSMHNHALLLLTLK